MLTTESPNPRSAAIDQMSILEALRVMNLEDATVPLVVGYALPAIARAVERITERLQTGGRLFYVGAGTSGRLAVIDAVECIPTFSVPPTLVQAVLAGGDAAFADSVETAEDNADAAHADLTVRGLAAGDALVAVAASGRTPYVLGAARFARTLGTLTIGISCNDPAPLLDSTEIAIALPTGAEVVAGSTRLKAGTAQKLVLNMISTVTMIQLGKVYGNRMVDVQVSNAKLEGRARAMLCDLTGIDDNAAARLLVASQNEVKTALVAALLNVSPDDARARLRAADGHVRRVLEAAQPGSPQS